MTNSSIQLHSGLIKSLLHTAANKTISLGNITIQEKAEIPLNSSEALRSPGQDQYTSLTHRKHHPSFIPSQPLCLSFILLCCFIYALCSDQKVLLSLHSTVMSYWSFRAQQLKSPFLGKAFTELYTKWNFSFLVFTEPYISSTKNFSQLQFYIILLTYLFNG